MKISNIGFSPFFKAHFYDVDTKEGNEITIKTDNKPYMGDNPHLDFGGEFQSKMKKRGDYFASCFPYGEVKRLLNYKIEYSGVVDNSGEKALDVIKLCNKATIIDKAAHKQPLINAISKGTAHGRVVVCKDMEEIIQAGHNSKEPLVVVSDNLGTDLSSYRMPLNVTGFVAANLPMRVLSHDANILRSKTLAAAVIFDKGLMENLKKLDGELVELKVKSGHLDYKLLDKISAAGKEKLPVNVPQLMKLPFLLSERDYSEKFVGAKACNLLKLRKMVSLREIDVKVPKSFAIPYGFIEKMLEENEEWNNSNKAEYTKLINGEIDEDTYIDIIGCFTGYKPGRNCKTIIELNNMLQCMDGSRGLIIRSAFNDEDIENHSAAGLYSSIVSSKVSPSVFDVYDTTLCIAASKWTPKAYQSRINDGIPHSVIKPTALVQEYIPTDHMFTIYTKDQDGFLRIEINSTEGTNEQKEPYVFLYNRETDELKMESIERMGRKMTFDEDLNFVNAEPVRSEIADNYEKYEPIIRKIVKNAIAVERKFGKPQDIEGGLNGANVCFWQTRNI